MRIFDCSSRAGGNCDACCSSTGHNGVVPDFEGCGGGQAGHYSAIRGRPNCRGKLGFAFFDAAEVDESKKLLSRDGKVLFRSRSKCVSQSATCCCCYRTRPSNRREATQLAEEHAVCYGATRILCVEKMRNSAAMLQLWENANYFSRQTSVTTSSYLVSFCDAILNVLSKTASNVISGVIFSYCANTLTIQRDTCVRSARQFCGGAVAPTPIARGATCAGATQQLRSGICATFNCSRSNFRWTFPAFCGVAAAPSPNARGAICA
uniref:(northern house mosquito) hypothetical protein n=1 Tax=Culex pipiens TaxID=7175 RepID=A0A8D8NYX5_CULPI